MPLFPLSANHGLSREFFDFIKAIGETRSKQEEDRLIDAEVSRLGKLFADSETSNTRPKELMLRVLYCDMLGHDVSMFHIKAVSLAADKNPWNKRTGFIVCSRCLSPKDELLLLLVNTIQKDLASSDFLDVLSALSICSSKIHAEAVPVLLPSIINLVGHVKDTVKKQALCALTHVYRKNVSILPDIGPCIKKAIHESDTGVVCATLELIHLISKNSSDPASVRFISDWIETLVPTLVAILRDMISHRVPKESDYHKVPAPWLQMKILRLLAKLVGKSPRLSEEVYEVLRIVLGRCDLQTNISYAIMYETVLTVAAIYPLPSLCKLAAQCVARFIDGPNKNLKLAGLQGLSQLVKIDPSYLVGHQLPILDCLEDGDETLRLTALNLLAQTTNVSNSVSVVQQLLKSAEGYIEEQPKRILVSKAIDLTERYAPSTKDYVILMSEILMKHSSRVGQENVRDFIQLTADGPAGIPEEDHEFRKFAAAKALSLLEATASLHDAALQVAFWVLGSYGNLLPPSVISQFDLLDLMGGILAKRRTYELPETKAMMVSQLINLTARTIVATNMFAHARSRSDDDEADGWLVDVLAVLEGQLSSDFDIDTRILEFQNAIASRDLELLKHLYPFDGYSEDVSHLLTDDSWGEKLRSLGLDFSGEVPVPASDAVTADENKPELQNSLRYTPYQEDYQMRPASFEQDETYSDGEGGEDEFKIGTGNFHSGHVAAPHGGKRWSLSGIQVEAEPIPSESHSAAGGEADAPQEVAFTGARRNYGFASSISVDPPIASETPVNGPRTPVSRTNPAVDFELERRRKAASMLFAGIS